MYDPVHTAENAVVNFLAEIQDDSALGYSAVNTARSALSAITVLPSGNTVGNLPGVKRCLRGVFNTKPSLPRYCATWDIKIVLDYCRTLKLCNMPLKLLSKKLTMMFAMFSVQRLAAITKIKVDNIFFTSNTCTIYIEDLLKTSKPGRHLVPGLEFSRFDDNIELCLFSHLKLYIELTSKLRNDNYSTSNQLLLSFIKPHGHVTVDTTRRWVRDVMTTSGVDTRVFGAHSVRGASTSALLNNGMAMDDVLKKVGWANELTVARHYNKPIVKRDNVMSVLVENH